MSETRMLPKSSPRTTGIPNHVQPSTGRPINGNTNGVTASPSAGRQAQQIARAAHGQPARTPPLRADGPGVELLQQQAQRPGGRPPQAMRIALEAPPFTVDQINYLGALVQQDLATAQEKNDEPASRIALDAMTSLGDLLEKTLAAQPLSRERESRAMQTSTTPSANAQPVEDVPAENAPVVAQATTTTVIATPAGSSLANDRG